MKHLQIYNFIAEIAKRGSIRKTAECLHITPSALTRKIQDFEEELGSTIFERHPNGMRLNAAGELLMQYILAQEANFESLQTQLSDLEGIRRGHVSIASAQAFIDTVLPDEIAQYRSQFPQVSFSVDIRDNQLGIHSLVNYEADLVLLIDPPSSNDLLEMAVCYQPLCAVMDVNHPLSTQKMVTIQECARYKIAMPSNTLAIRGLLDDAIYRSSVDMVTAVESGSLEFLRSFVTKEDAITFQPFSAIPHTDQRLCSVPMHPDDISPLRVVLGQLRGRQISIAAARFAEQLITRLQNDELLV